VVSNKSPVASTIKPVCGSVPLLPSKVTSVVDGNITKTTILPGNPEGL
jgi:hypothetical protein